MGIFNFNRTTQENYADKIAGLKVKHPEYAAIYDEYGLMHQQALANVQARAALQGKVITPKQLASYANLEVSRDIKQKMNLMKTVNPQGYAQYKDAYAKLSDTLSPNFVKQLTGNFYDGEKGGFQLGGVAGAVVLGISSFFFLNKLVGPVGGAVAAVAGAVIGAWGGKQVEEMVTGSGQSTGTAKQSPQQAPSGPAQQRQNNHGTPTDPRTLIAQSGPQGGARYPVAQAGHQEHFAPSSGMAQVNARQPQGRGNPAAAPGLGHG